MLALGMMSGTSLDGVDAALIETDGVAITGFGRSGYRPYSTDEQAVLRAALGRWPGEPSVGEAAALTLAAHAELAAAFPEARLIGFHGQTLAHDPRGRGTHQAGSGAVLAQMSEKDVVWDFRSEDVRRGGEGAPLAPYFHHACARWAVMKGHLPSAPVAFLNLGGVGNVTWVDPELPDPELAGACLAFDTGPANAPLNDLLMRRLGRSRDQGGVLASSGCADEAVIEGFLQHPYFSQKPPKSLDRDAFGPLVDAVDHLCDADAAATLVAVAASAVAAGWRWMPKQPERLLVCGGGRHNAALMTALSLRLNCAVEPVEVAGLDGDMLEAQAFAWLAVRVLRGLPTSGPTTTGVQASCSGGRISRSWRRQASGGNLRTEFRN